MHRASQPGSHTALYECLGVDPKASASEIKKAYHKLSLLNHPDKNKSPEAAELFKRISNANSILSDPKKREIYDAFGEEAANTGADPTMGGFMHPGMHPGMQKQVKRVDYKLKLSDLFIKTQVEFVLDREVKCTDCDATGFSDKVARPCKQCGGAGIFTKMMRNGPFMQQAQGICPSCKGSKVDTSMSKLTCKTCQGETCITIPEKIVCDIPNDITHQPMTLIAEKGPWMDGAYIDLMVVFKLLLPKGYSMTSDKRLMYTMSINYTETMCGFKRTIKHPTGRELLIVSKPGHVVNPNHIYSIESCGFGSDKMYLMFVISYPKTPLFLADDAKTTMLTWSSIGDLMGPRSEPDYTGDTIDPSNTYDLDMIECIDNSNPNMNRTTDSDEEDGLVNEDEHDHAHGVNCAQQ
ncbi:DnaJ molecular chaperone [uncultured virus]|nr:DnaJ molecular chaperone [uncultured virus]